MINLGMSYKVVRAGSLKVGSYVIVDGEPCEIVELSKSKPGKHGSAKLRAVAIGIFDGVKRTLLCPVDTQVNVPVIEKRSGQVLSVSGETVQLMDLMSYEVFEAPMPREGEVRAKLTPGAEVSYWKVGDRVRIAKVRAGEG